MSKRKGDEAVGGENTELNGQAVKVRKARGGAGMNHTLGRWVKVGDECDVSVEVAAQCLIGKEFDLVNEVDADRVAAAMAEILRRDHGIGGDESNKETEAAGAN